ncbi:hypothetical protein HPB52_011926 [Rhipicephalus sanguineus]|uniref:Uncharacterized protein n=1 Tax=Rhipicephalus sanguineus TaxID=34632 RepID=A0A9D4PZI0_RHISA|nr:hypothetical protein HPB52_011926 [Rhipicephalus sanguineus]
MTTKRLLPCTDQTKEAASQSSKRVPLPPRPSDSEDETDNSVSESSGDSLHEMAYYVPMEKFTTNQANEPFPTAERLKKLQDKTKTFNGLWTIGRSRSR